MRNVMKLEFDKQLTPAERFKRYVEMAKWNYELSNDCKKATNKAILEWYNKKYHASLSESSISKYLSGTNEIPIDVYVNMKELAGIEDMYYGLGASREDYEISSDFKESLQFIKDEIEFMCKLEELEGLEGDSIKDILKTLIQFCECASRKEYQKEILLLQELEKRISYNESKIKEVINNRTMAPSSDRMICCKKSNIFDDIDSSSKNYNCGSENDIEGYHCHKHLFPDFTRDSDYITQNSGASEIDNKKNYYNISMLDLEIINDRYNRLSHFIHRCINLHKKISEESYMDIPAKEESDILRSLQSYIER